MTTSQSKLFPPPSRLLSALSPKVLPGSSPELLRTVQDILQDNQKKYHVFFNEKGFHNHIVHHILALWALGANGDAIEAAYREDISIQRPAFSSPEPITTANFNDHLGDENFYNAYLTFFCGAVTQNDVGSVLEEFLFSDKANFGTKNAAGEHPEMLNRFLSGLIHPFIHVGYGIEFGLPGIVAEGLAQTAVHKADNTVLIPPSTFQTKSVGKLTSFIHSMKPSNKTDDSLGGSLDAFTILARIMKDPNMKMNAPNELTIDLFNDTVKKHGEALLKLVNSWALDTSDPKNVERKIEELQWLNTLIYAVAGFKDGKDAFNADFFYMHLVTSSLFLPTLVVHLSPWSQEVFLRSYFGICLSVYIARGGPNLDIELFFNAEIPRQSGNNLTSSIAPKLKLPPSSPSLTSSPNPWFPIIEQTILHPDEHLCKLQRALAHYSTLYGWKSALFEGHTELLGAQRIDGTLFIRAAELTAARLGREYEKDTTGFWDRKGFYLSPKGKL